MIACGVVAGAHVFTGQYHHQLSSPACANASQSIISLSSYIDKLSSLFMAIGRAAPRYQAMALLYPRFKKLQSYLAEHFILVVKLCHYLFKYEQKSTVRQLAFSLWKCSNLARSSGERKPKCEYLTSVPNTTTKQHGNRSENLVTHRSTRKAQSMKNGKLACFLEH